MTATTTAPTVSAADFANDLINAQLDEVRSWTIGMRDGQRVRIDLPMRTGLMLMASLVDAMSKPGTSVFVDPQLQLVLRADQVDYVFQQTKAEGA